MPVVGPDPVTKGVGYGAKVRPGAYLILPTTEFARMSQADEPALEKAFAPTSSAVTSISPWRASRDASGISAKGGSTHRSHRVPRALKWIGDGSRLVPVLPVASLHHIYTSLNPPLLRFNHILFLYVLVLLRHFFQNSITITVFDSLRISFPPSVAAIRDPEIRSNQPYGHTFLSG